MRNVPVRLTAIDLGPPAQRLFGRVGEGADPRDVAEIGDDAQLVGAPRHRRRHRLLVGDVALQGQSLSPLVGRFLVYLLRHGDDGRVDVEAGDGRPFGGQAAGRGATDARGGPGDHGHPPVVAARHQGLHCGAPVGIGLSDSGGGAHGCSFSWLSCPITRG